jgi:acyl-CoA synthetase (AMP-forming)/AMP-acid ligase II
VDLSQHVAAVLAVDPSASALVQDGVWDTWGDVQAIGDGIIAQLRDQPSDAAVGVITRNRIAVVSGVLGLLAAGRAVLTLNDMQADAALAAEVATLRPAVLVLVTEDWGRPGLAEAAERAGCRVVLVERGPGACVTVIRPGRSGADGEYFRAGPDCAISLKTSGTTGPPKRIELSYSSLSASIEAVRFHHGGQSDHAVRLRSGATIQMLALAHTSAIQSVCTTVADGRQLALLDRFEPRAWAELVRDHKVVTTGIPPSAIRMVLDSEIPVEWLSSLKAVRAGSAPLDPAVAEEFTARYGVPVLQAYGATEFQGLASWTLKDYRAYHGLKEGAVGRVHPGVEVRVVDPESHAVLPTGSPGVLEVRTAQATHGAASDWIRTSDLARADEDGFLWILGRADGAINRGGFKIDPSEVAAALSMHQAVREATVVALPDRRLGQVPAAAVELVAGAEDPGEVALKAWVRERLEPYKVPVRIRVMAALPRTVALKPDKAAILRVIEEAELPNRS